MAAGDPTGAPGPAGGPPPNPNPTPSQQGAALTVQQAWDGLMRRIGFYRVDLVKYGHTNLNRVDTITGVKSTKLPL